ELGQAAVDLLPDLVGHYRLEWRGGDLDRQIALADVAGVDDDTIAAPDAFSGPVLPHQEARNLLDGLLRCGQTDARRPLPSQLREPLQRQRKMAAALVTRERMDFVDDH